MEKINVLYQSSSLYVIPAAISICSLFENNKELDYIKVWFIDDGLSDNDKKNLNDLIERYNRCIEYINPKPIEKLLEQNNIEKWNGAYATFYKLFVQNEVKDVDRLIYIDSDTIVNGSLVELNNIDLDGFACGMVASPISKTIRDYLSVDPYYNGGFEVYNMQYWKENNISGEILNVIKDKDIRYKYTVIADETLINKTLSDRIKKLPLKYDCEITWWLWGTDKGMRRKLGWGNNEGFYSIKDVKEAYSSPAIMHYTNLTTGRPWDYLNDHPFKKEFLKYKELLKPWKTLEIHNKGFGGDNKLLLSVKFVVNKLLPMYIRRRIGYKQHDSICKRLINNAENRF